LSKRIYGAWAKSSNGSKIMQKAIEEHNKWNTGFNAVCEKYSNFQTNITVTFKRQGEERLE
jgi:hypothetical protein